MFDAQTWGARELAPRSLGEAGSRSLHSASRRMLLHAAQIGSGSPALSESRGALGITALRKSGGPPMMFGMCPARTPDTACETHALPIYLLRKWWPRRKPSSPRRSPAKRPRPESGRNQAESNQIQTESGQKMNEGEYTAPDGAFPCLGAISTWISPRAGLSQTRWRDKKQPLQLRRRGISVVTNPIKFPAPSGAAYSVP